MNLPVSWLSALLPQSLPAFQATARSLSYSAQTFGAALLHGPPSPTNGPSEGASKETADSLKMSESATQKASDPAKADPSAKLRARLASLVARIRASLGIEQQTPPVQLVADGVGIPEVHGPEGLRQALQAHLHQAPELVSEINTAARRELDEHPLRWMPGNEPTLRWTIDG